MDLLEIFEKYPTQESCISHLETVRWANIPKCPYCKSEKQTPLKEEKRYHCNNCNTSFSVTVYTIFHHTHLPLQKWFFAVSLILNAKKGISARQLARDLHVNRNTAWRIAMQVRNAMFEPEQRGILQGLVEMDETHIGPRRPRKTQKDIMNGRTFKRGMGTNKTSMVGMVERYGKVRAMVLRKGGIKTKKLKHLVQETIDLDKSVLMTDAAIYYRGMSKLLSHYSVDHSSGIYVDGWKHTNSIESFWALLKRGIVGQFHKVSVKHLHNT